MFYLKREKNATLLELLGDILNSKFTRYLTIPGVPVESEYQNILPILLATWKTSFIGGSLSFMGLLPLYENFSSLKYLITISKYERNLFCIFLVSSIKNRQLKLTKSVYNFSKHA